MRSFSIKTALIVGWEGWKRHGALLVFLWIMALLIPLIPNIIQTNLVENAPVSRFVLAFIHFFLSLITGMGMVTIALKAARGEEYQFSDFFSKINKIVPYFVAQVLFYLVVGFGFVLLIIPGIWFALKYCLYPFVVIDSYEGGVNALKNSNKITHGNKWHILLFWLVTFGINILGLLCLGIGIFITAPVTMIAWAHVYDRLIQSQVDYV